MTARCTAAEHDIRTHAVVELLLVGTPRQEILRYVAEDTDWGINERQVDNYIKGARDVIAKTAERSTDVQFGLGQQRLNRLYNDALRVQDLRTALGVVREQNKLHDLTTTKHVEQSAPEPFEVVLTHKVDDEG